MSSRHALLSFATVLVIAAPMAVRAAGNFDPPAGAQFSEHKLAKVGEFLRSEIAAGKIPGAILLIQRHGKPVYSEAFGVRDVVSQAQLTGDTIFRLHSLTKAITAVTAMMLVDEGRLKLDDPLTKYIPSFASVKVGVEKTLDNGDKTLALEPLQRPITIRDLMLHTSGLTYGFYGDSPVRRAYAAADLYAGDYDTAEFAERLARLPLSERPGTLWNYGHSMDVIGRVIEVVSGQSLLQVEKQKLLDPLGMKNTSFYVTDPDKQKRLAQPMPDDSDFRVGRLSRPDIPKKMQSGGGGMVSTRDDLAPFLQMLLNGGTLDRRRYLSPEIYTQMTTDHIGPDSGVARDYLYFPGDGFGFGYGFGVRTDPGHAKPPPPGSLGELKWDGASGCYFVIDRKLDMFFLLLQQTPSERQRIQRTVKMLIYDALAY